MTKETYWSNEIKGKKAEDYIRSRDPFDVNCWMILIREAQLRPIGESRVIFERCLIQFPGCYRFLKLYLEKEAREGDPNSLSNIYERYLPIILNIELYQSYLQHFKDTHSNDSDFSVSMLKAYEFAVKNVGFDYLALPIWMSYLQFAKSCEVMGAYAEGQKIHNIRKLFARILSIPMANIDQIWKEYVAYEQGINKISGEKIATERLRDFNVIRKVAKELEAMIRGIIRTSIPIPPQNTPSEKRQLDLWNKYINWEKNNPLNIEDNFSLAQRVIYAYEQFLQNFSFHTHVWVEVSQYAESFYRKVCAEGDQTRATELANACRDIYRRGVNGPMHDSLIFHLCYADFEEGMNNTPKSIEIYEKLLTSLDIDRSLVYIHYMKHVHRTKGAEESRRIFQRACMDQSVDYRVYANASFREFISNKNLMASIKIFEMAIKRFPSSQELVMIYLNHLKRVDDPNIIRSSFERLICLFDSEISRLVFREFHKFESEFGGLNSSLQLEDRILERYSGEYENLRLIFDRYGFSSDLFYCSNAKSLLVSDKDEESKNPLPDLSQMRPFKPYSASTAFPNLPSTIPGGVFLPPYKVFELISRLPPPACFNGPYVNVEMILQTIVDQFGSKPTVETLNHIDSTNIDQQTSRNEQNLLDDLFRARQERRATRA